MKTFGASKARLHWGYVLLVLLAILILWDVITKNQHPVPITGSTQIYLGVSVVEKDFSTILHEINNIDRSYDGVGNDSLTSFILQSPDPAALIYLDYIRFDEDPDLPNSICFKAITMTKSGHIPTVQIDPDLESSELEITPEYYKYTFPPERCMQRGEKYIMPHVLLGVLQVNASANILGLPLVRGYESFKYFPFDKQDITFDISVELDNNLSFVPSIEAVIAQEGWESRFTVNENGKPVLHSRRYAVYNFMLVPFFFIILVVILYLYEVVEKTGAFLEIAFSLLLGLWGTYEIFSPSYITISIPVNVIIQTLFILLTVEIFFTMAPVINSLFLNIRIENRASKDEKTIIEFRSPFPLTLPETYLYDHQSQTRIHLPPIEIPFGWRRGREIVFWTRKPSQSDPSSNRYIIYMYLERDEPLWTDIHSTVHFKDTTDRTLAKYSY